MAIELIGIPQEQMIVYETTVEDCSVHYYIEKIVKEREEALEEFYSRVV